MKCDGPGMHRLHDGRDMVAPCPACGTHHLGPDGKISDSVVSIIPSPAPTLTPRLRGLVCKRRDHVWGPYERAYDSHFQQCKRCGSARVAVPLDDNDHSKRKEGP